MSSEDTNAVTPLPSGEGPDLSSGAIALQPKPPRLKIRKLSPELRRRRPRYGEEPNVWKRLLLRLREDTQFVRSLVQWSFFLLVVWIGVEFTLFMRWAQSGGAGPAVSRPPGVEGFLPISALISLKYWMETGIVNVIHPSGLFILFAIIAVSLLLKKSFCGWLCPVGTVSESLWMLGEKIFGRNVLPPKWIDLPLRGLKYLLLIFFVLSISAMDVDSMATFIYSPYNKVADVKMYLFFAEITSFAFWTIMLLVVGSVFVKGFWCRYLCPYGALLGVASWFSPLKITRNASTCIDCALCTKACPANISVHTRTKVRSDECMSCYRCVEACPVKNTLSMQTIGTSRPVPAWIFGLLVAGTFVGITGLAMATGHWKNAVSPAEYLHRVQTIDSPMYQHFQGKVPAYGPQD